MLLAWIKKLFDRGFQMIQIRKNLVRNLAF